MKLQLINTATFGPLFVENCFPNPVVMVITRFFLGNRLPDYFLSTDNRLPITF